ncbi:hypothetical protein A2865_04035 [Candidatus Woesebacteria bacterium RIFCSPHIGHO2_01_FULL_39_17]|uniref:Uncharacterized protein n=3 Tax=Candidatus Woeseibacteriota TaxID=1752722 RepID=A0A0G0NLJ1_9BACT|nr:MAG: hypothetical protein US72_C0012G0005 [Microgenomates group bacterium GW2011_GWC1_38_12]KKQ93494.1 MAG: hypothetical protein UT19_C0011G0039 [Candidatus Woesebacteria bacterium GW2011_GWB1_39_10b]KKR13656.1 MAG: hypothetical protein UT40_C0012G0022 [Candidatus Woesebacteria bacterium GW2011_GWA1_39_21b]OGM23277.1 MAG: hypothetical protein A2865_04035 [Candidatus Woesebacteria bacterium RIFCSPHIGHO2_01_FULL_39_17]OGM65705.1 MAG: hypothetical protein A3A52_05255 [Candidatus Woesebacteria b
MDPVQNSNNNLQDLTPDSEPVSPSQNESTKPSFVTQEVPAQDQSQTPTTEQPREVPQVQIGPQPDTPNSILTPTPSSQTTPEPLQEPPKSGKSRIIPFVAGLLLLIFFILIITAGATYTVAYEKIKLNKNPEFQKKVAYFVMSLPFTPKTPKFLLTRTGMAHQDVTKESFNISLAVDSKDIASSLGLSGLDVEAKGAIDYSDPKNVKLNLDTSITKDFNFELRKKDKFLYFKINKLPSTLLALAGLKVEDFTQILDTWVSYDTSPLDTEARKSIQDEEIDPLSGEYLDETFEKYVDAEVLSKMVLEEVTEEATRMYKITLNADPALIDHLGQKFEEERKKAGGAYLNQPGEPQKLSDMVKVLKWEVYIEPKSYYTKKLIVTADLETDKMDYGNLFLGTSSSPSEKSQTKIAFAAKFDDFGEEVVVQEPEGTITFEEFTNIVSEILKQIYKEFFNSQYSSSDAELELPDNL